MELDENKIKEIEILKLLFHLPAFWEKERSITVMEARRAIESEDRDTDSVLLVDSYLGANEEFTKATFKFDPSQKLTTKWKQGPPEGRPAVALILNDGSLYTEGITNFNQDAGEVTIRWSKKVMDEEDGESTRADPNIFLSEVKALTLWDWRERYDHSRSLLNVINDYLNHDFPSVTREIIEKNKPKTGSVTMYRPNEDGNLIEPALKAVKNLDRSFLPIQGPPGTGKTYIGSHIISRLLAEGGNNNRPRIAIVSQGWELIDNLFRSTIHRLCEAGLRPELENKQIKLCRRKAFKPVAERARKFPQVHELFEVGNGLPKERKSIQYGVSPHNDNEGEEWYFNSEEDNSPEPVLPIKGVDLHSGADLLAATSWFFVSAQMREACKEEIYGDDFKFDYIFLDEAGQYSLAETLAISHAAKNIVLLGDPKQLPQVVKANHECGADLSVMEYLIGKDRNADPSKGFYLGTTWRMREEVTMYISEQFYDHDLDWKREICNEREILGMRNGLYFSEVEHEECSRSSKIEAEKVVEIVDDLLAMTFKDSSNGEVVERMVAESDFIIVTAFNDQRQVLISQLERKGYSGVRVGTVDKFQGQEAPIVIYSLTSSNKEEIPAGRTEFLFMPNRTNVAVSRAQCLAVVVGAKDLIDTQPKTILEMEALNSLCRVFQDVEEGKGISGEWPSANSVIHST